MKRMIRRALLPPLFRSYPRIIVASSGRAGSTMLFDAVTNSLVRARFGWSRDEVLGRLAARLISGYIDRIDVISDEPYIVYKTHDTFHFSPEPNVRTIFVYGDPLESAMSVARIVKEKGEDWFSQHQYHLRAIGSLSDLFQRDVLNYEGQIRSWLGEHRVDVMCVDYEDLWDARQSITDFLEFEISLPVRRPRKTKPSGEMVNKELFSELRTLKSDLKSNYERLNVEK